MLPVYLEWCPLHNEKQTLNYNQTRHGTGLNKRHVPAPGTDLTS